MGRKKTITDKSNLVNYHFRYNRDVAEHVEVMEYLDRECSVGGASVAKCVRQLYMKAKKVEYYKKELETLRNELQLVREERRVAIAERDALRFVTGRIQFTPMGMPEMNQQQFNSMAYPGMNPYAIPSQPQMPVQPAESEVPEKKETEKKDVAKKETSKKETVKKAAQTAKKYEGIDDWDDFDDNDEVDDDGDFSLGSLNI